MKINCLLNNKQAFFNTYSDKPLSLLLTEEAAITSLQIGCGTGRCGNCILLIDDKPVLSCLIPAFSVAGKRILTFEGFTKTRFHSEIKRAYKKHQAYPCDQCYAAKTLIIHSIISDNMDPEPEDIIQALQVNTCNCLNYDELTQIVQTAAGFRRRKRRVRRS